MNAKNSSSWALRIIAAIILLQTLYFKFSGHEESVALFTKLASNSAALLGCVEFDDVYIL